MPKPATPVIEGLEKYESFKGGPRAGQTWNDELPCLLIDERNGFKGLMCRWELSEDDRRKIAGGADIFLTLFITGCPPMYLEVFGKNVDPDYIVKERGVILPPSSIRKYSESEIENLEKQKRGESIK